VSRHPIYDLMCNYLTLSWAHFSKDVQSHTLQISKILSHPAPHAGDLIKLDTSAMAKSDAASAGGPDMSLEVIVCFPRELDFGSQRSSCRTLEDVQNHGIYGTRAYRNCR